MGLFSRLKVGFTLARRSLRLLRDHPKLAVLPAIAGVAGLAYLVVLWLSLLGGSLQGSTTTTYAILFVFYLGSTFIASYFTAALVFCTDQALRGERPSIGAGLRAASRKLAPLLVWSLVSAVVGVLLRALEDSDTPVARVLAAVFSVGWTVMTFFVVPVIVFEDVGAVEMFTRSKDTVVETWGESLGAYGGVGLVTVAFALVGIVLGVLLALVLPGAAGLLGVLVIVGAVLVAGLLGQTLTGITKTALYVYATEDEAPAYFEGIDFGDLGGDGAGGRTRGLLSRGSGGGGNI